MKVYIHTWGCQMNVLDSEVIRGEFAAQGVDAAAAVEDADIIVFNTCSVREHAENKVLSRLGALKELKARRPDVTVVIAGCMAQRLGGELLRRYPQLDLVVGTRRIGEFVDLVREARAAGRAVHVEEDRESYPRRDSRFRASRAQAFVSVMRGCDNFCAYCIVPFVRGRQASRPADEVIDEVKALSDDGVVEVTLLGQNATAYGRDRGETGALARLLEGVSGVAGIEWIRFVTSHPRDTGDDVFRAMRELPKLCPYMHLPAQSGSDRILKAMGRGYTRREYLDRIGRLHKIAGDVSVAGDFIVGFPGETEDDFEDSAGLIRAVGYKNSFIFKYSPREGTAAARLSDDVPLAEKKRRNNALLAVQEEVSLAHNSGFVGRRVEVLVEGASKKGGKLSGRTAGDEIVIFQGPPGIEGRFIEVEITGASAVNLFGRLAG